MPLLSVFARNLHTDGRTHVTILALGRGVGENGELSVSCKHRVRQTLQVARDLQEEGLTLLIIWTGRMSLGQLKAGITIGGAGSEAAAMHAFAKELAKPTDKFEQTTEVNSTSTVGNMAYCAEIVRERELDESVIVPVTDTLHFLYERVEFAARLMFPRHYIRPIELLSNYTRKGQVMQAVSAFITRHGMRGVERGNKEAVLKRQAQLEKLTNWLPGR